LNVAAAMAGLGSMRPALRCIKTAGGGQGSFETGVSGHAAHLPGRTERGNPIPAGSIAKGVGVMHTSHFWRFYHENDPRLVSIALKSPEWFKGREYPNLAPGWTCCPWKKGNTGGNTRRFWTGSTPGKFTRTWGPSRFYYAGAAWPVLSPADGVEWLESSLGVKVPELPQNYDQRQKDLFTEGG